MHVYMVHKTQLQNNSILTKIIITNNLIDLKKTICVVITIRLVTDAQKYIMCPILFYFFSSLNK